MPKSDKEEPMKKLPAVIPELLFKREGYLLGFAAGDAAHACCEPGCPCYEAGRVAEAEEPSVLGRQT